jgi:Skp family chaperone for outer membrane proteins
MRCIYIVFITSVLSLGCASEALQREKIGVAIRYVNLEFLIQYMYRKNGNIRKNIKEQQEVKQRLNMMNRDGQYVTGHKSGEETYNTLTARLKELKQEENRFKKQLYQEIDKVIKSIAVRLNIPLILNMQESILYAESELDITKEVIAELEKRHRKYKPVSR